MRCMQMSFDYHIDARCATRYNIDHDQELQAQRAAALF